MERINVVITANEEGKTIKEYLKLNHIGRGKVEEIRVNKLSFINNEYQPLEHILFIGEVLSFHFSENIDYIPDNIPIDVIYEDDYLLAVNKSADLIIHPDEKGKTGTLVNRVAAYYKNHHIHRNIRYLHRLDKDTTGLVLFAKDYLTEAIMLQKIEQDDIKRDYIGISEGNFAKSSGKISAPIGEDRHKSKKMCVCKNGKPSLTTYKVIKHFEKFDEVMFTLHTGRTHQIRVHAEYIHHPIVGDTMYGHHSTQIHRVALHCYSLSFIHPITKKEVVIAANLPEDIKKLIGE